MDDANRGPAAAGWRRTKDVLAAALERPPVERSAFLDQACSGDGTLRADVESLLAAHAAAGPFAEVSPLDHLESRDGWVLAPGDQLGPYRIVSRVGSGGMGQVYRATDTRLQRDVAIKILPPELSAEAQLRQRVEREARAIAALRHPHICVLYDLGHARDLDFLVMEFLDGESLATRLMRGPLSREEVCRYGAEIAEALAEMHRQGIIHRDVKPANIMLTARGAKLLDFGTAKQPLVRQGQLDATTGHAAAAIVGTLHYMAPEQLEGQPVDARTDVFAFGAVLYEMVTARRAFDGISDASVIAAILDRQPAPLARSGVVAPPIFERVIDKCLRKDPDERWQRADDISAALHGTVVPRTSATSATVEDPLEPHVNAPSARSNRLTILRLAVFSVPVIIGLGTWFYARIQRDLEIRQLEFKGNFYGTRWTGTEGELRKGIEYYNRALALDASDASAYQGVAAAWVFLSDAYVSPREAMPKAKAAAVNALQRNETSAGAHVSLGLVKMQYDWDWAGAEREFKRAMALRGQPTVAPQLYAWWLMSFGRIDEARVSMLRVVEGDPLDDFSIWTLGLSFYFEHQYDQAIEQYRRAMRVAPQSYWSHMLIGWAFEQQGNFSQAIVELNRANRLTDNPQVVASLARALALSGQRTEAERVLAELQMDTGRYISPYDIATVYVGLGDKQEGLAWLEKAYVDRSGWLAWWLRIDPKFDTLRSDAQFRDLLQRVGHS